MGDPVSEYLLLIYTDQTKRQDLGPQDYAALHDDYVSLNAASFATLWEMCCKNSVTVVADIHTHRFGAGQSPSDCANPMVALPGHVAFIVPHFAQRDVNLYEMGTYVYKGAHTWTNYSGSDVARMLRLIANGDAQS